MKKKAGCLNLLNLVSCGLILLLLLSMTPFPAAHAIDAEELVSESALLMEYDTGEIILAVNEHEKLFPASLTKIMTLLLAMEALSRGEISLDNQVPVTERAASMGGTQLFLSPGDVVDMESLLMGVAVGSGNDAAVAVAEYISGSEEAFVERMNERARELGLKNTNFINCSGLHHDEQYSSAYDVAVMGRELLSYPQFFRWSTIWMDENFLEGKIESGKVYLSNTNHLIRRYSGCDGIKTGYTSEAGHNIAATAQRNDSRFIAVVMNAPSSDVRYEEAAMLLSHGFATYYSVMLADKFEKVTTLPVEKGDVTEVDVVTSDKLSLLIKKGEEPRYRAEVSLPPRLQAPISLGESVGKAAAFIGDKKVKEVDLEVALEVEEASFGLLFWRHLQMWLKFGR